MEEICMLIRVLVMPEVENTSVVYWGAPSRTVRLVAQALPSSDGISPYGFSLSTGPG